MKQSKDQISFIRDMHFAGIIGGAFQRSNIYKPRSTDIRKKEFREALQKFLETIESIYNQSAITTSRHVTLIKRLQSWSAKFKDILNGGKLNFGISQKLLNLHLKGLWCFGLLKYAPPHFPVDRIIQERFKIKPIIAWTKIKDKKEYLRIINAAEKIALKHKVKLPELELRVYNGTLTII